MEIGSLGPMLVTACLSWEDVFVAPTIVPRVFAPDCSDCFDFSADSELLVLASETEVLSVFSVADLPFGLVPLTFPVAAWIF